MSITERDLFLAAARLAAAVLANPTSGSVDDQYSQQQAMEVAIASVRLAASNKGIFVLTEPLEEAVYRATNQ
jgi:hypothetical protein